MIDVESKIFTIIYNNLKKDFPKLYITGEPISIPPEFPCASIYEADNYTYEKTQDSGCNENHTHVMYEVYVYSNKKNGRKTECKEIFNAIDKILTSKGFARKSKIPINDGNIYRLVGRFTAVISKNNIIYRR